MPTLDTTIALRIAVAKALSKHNLRTTRQHRTHALRRIMYGRLVLILPALLGFALFFAPDATVGRAVLIVASTVAFGLVIMREQRLRLQLRAADNLLCRQCLYDLSDHEIHSVQCPECGSQYTLRGLRHAWEHTFLLAWPPME